MHGEHVVFTSNEMTKLIMQNNDGSLAFGNDLLSMNEGSLFDCICKSMQTDFTAYKNKLQSKLAELTNDDLDLEDNSTPVIESIFLNEVPCSFRHIVNVCKRYKADENGDMHFEGFVVKPNKKIVDHLDFDSFITALAKNFQKMTRGALKKQEEYKAFSNRLDEAAVTHWILPSEDCWKKAVIPAKWKEYMSGKAKPRILQRLFWYIGAMQDARNYAEQALVISDGGGTGKSTFLELLKALFPTDFFGYITNSTLDDRKDFALSERRTYEHHCLVLDEYDGRSLNSPVFKNLIGTKVPISMPVKNKQAIEHNFKGTKMIVVSNEVSVLETHAYRRRVIPISFSINHKAKESYSEADKQDLIAEGKDFLNFCYRVYKSCKCIKPNGEYYVLNPELEENFLNDEEINLKEEIVSMKAISQDEEICDYFNVHDYEESDISLEFQEFIDKYFVVTGNANDIVTMKSVKEHIEDIASKNFIEIKELFENALTVYKGNNGEGYVSINIRQKTWWIFLKTLETAGAQKKNIRISPTNKPTKCIIGLKINGKENDVERMRPVLLPNGNDAYVS